MGPEGLCRGWTLMEADQRLVGNKLGATRRGFALVLKFVELHGRFPEDDDGSPAGRRRGALGRKGG